MQTIRLQLGEYKYDQGKALGPPGGFGQVFLGQTSDGLPVAVKRLHLHASEAAHRELDIAAELLRRQYQHVIGFLDAGLDADGAGYFVVMAKAEYSLQDRLRLVGRFEAAEAAAILLEIVRGLLELPALVHRDIKPGNILWHQNCWKIADFGIARFVEETTSSRTLKACLSPLYAAPEQWRFERSTAATDVYALGCVAFELLTGLPPYRDDLERCHQTEPLPKFGCTDPRLASLVAVMVQKPPAARPSTRRVHDVLQGIVASPPASQNGAIGDLAVVGAAIASEQQRVEAEREALARLTKEREMLHRDAQAMLAENIERLWERIQTSASTARRVQWGQNPFHAQFHLGDASVEIGRIRHRCVAANEFLNSKWDVVSGSTLTVKNGPGQPYEWETSLWYVKRPNESDYRWIEVGYFAPFDRRRAPFSSNGYREADLAASRIMSGVQFSCGPEFIDGECESDFHDRCIWLFAKAAAGKLCEPRSQPISQWPPEM